MKNKILILLFTLLALLIWSCDEEPPLGPESQDVELSKKLPVGTVTPILDLNKTSLPEYPPGAPGDSPEGIAIDKRGNMYISNTRGPERSINEILKVHPDGSSYIYATLPGQGHATGLVTDKRGNVYVAFYTYGDLSRNGVYSINRRGNLQKLKGSQNIARPNALTFDSKGNLYVTSSYGEDSQFAGAIWRFSKRKGFELWYMDSALDGGPHPEAGTLPGANGIVFYPPNKLYVANTFQSSISCITIGKRGEARNVKWSISNFLLMNIDGIAVDVHENIYGVLPVSTINNLPENGPPPMPPVVMLNPKSQEVTPVVVSSEAHNFNTPTSLVFGTGGQWDRKSVYVANAGLFYGQSHEPWSNPGVVKVFVGIPGKPMK